MVTLVLLFGSPNAQACSLAAPATFEVDGLTTDTVPPAQPEVLDVHIQRGKGPVQVDGGAVATSCDDLGFVQIDLADPEGDAPDGVGYLMELVEGDLPDGLLLPEQAWLGPTLSLTWIDGATDEQDAFSAVVAITPIDAGGNEGEPVEVALVDDGAPEADTETTTADCSTVPLAPAGALWVLTGLLAGLRRRR